MISLLLSSAAFAVTPGAGDLVITEIMAAPSCTFDEWFEVYNPTGDTMDLDGCLLSSGTSEHTVGTASVSPGAYAVLHRSGTGSCPSECPDQACSVTPIELYGSLGFSNSDPDDVTITCGGVVVDTVTFDSDPWESCEADADACSIQLQTDALTAADNDDAQAVAGSWCPSNGDDAYTDGNAASALGTPGAANNCGEEVSDPGGGNEGGDPDVIPEDVCEPGDVIITELMVAPSPQFDEWMEFRAVNDCDLHSCQILSAYTTSSGNAVERDHFISVLGNSFPVTAGSDTVIARRTSAEIDGDATIEWARASGGAITPDYYYESTELSNSSAGTLDLICNGVSVDQVPYDWSAFEGDASTCPDGGCSVQLDPVFYDGAANDTLNNWCLPALADDNLYTPTTTLTDGTATTESDFTGTPAAENACPFFDWPDVGEVAFIEIMGAPQDTEEWFEIVNLTDRQIELTQCELRSYRADAILEDPTNYEDHVIGESGILVMEPNGLELFVKGGCLIEEAALDTGVAGDCTLSGYDYDSLSISSDNDEVLDLLCPNASGELQVIDRVEFNLEVSDSLEGRSLMFDSTLIDAEAATSNDDVDNNWCKAAFTQQFYQSGDEDCNYGTPGEVGECTTNVPLPPPSTVFPRCATTAAAGGVWAVLLGLFGVVRRRRR
ncbi:MAG: lamin tail domain-containing protein [Myxococcota bacterium]